MVKMLYIVDCGRNNWKEFDTYNKAESFCGESGIHPENIYEMTEGDM